MYAPREWPVSVTEVVPNCDIACCTAARIAVADLQGVTREGKGEGEGRRMSDRPRAPRTPQRTHLECEFR